MDYQKHYDLVIKRAKYRTLMGYKEKHHIVPKCLSGTDNKDNLVELTAREHFVVHQLLIKIYPSNGKLAYAAMMMCVESTTHTGRSKNRRYEWLRKKFSKEVSKNQTGKNNSQYGKRWIHNLDLKKSKKIQKDELIPDGWEEGRKLIFNVKENFCVCGEKIKAKSKTCNSCMDRTARGKKGGFSKAQTSREEVILALEKSSSYTECLQILGYTLSYGNTFNRIKRIAKEEGIKFTQD